MESILVLLSLPVQLLNFGGGIVGGVWLIFLGQWELVVGAILVSCLASIVISLVLSPVLLLGVPVHKLLEKGRIGFAYPLVAIGWVYNYLVMTVWCVGAFIVVMGYRQTGSILPYLLFAYCTATGVWTYMARHETSGGQNDALGTTIPVYFLCIGAISMIGVVLWGNPDIFNFTTAFMIPMCLSFILQSVVFFNTTRLAAKNP